VLRSLTAHEVLASGRVWDQYTRPFVPGRGCSISVSWQGRACNSFYGNHRPNTITSTRSNSFVRTRTKLWHRALVSQPVNCRHLLAAYEEAAFLVWVYSREIPSYDIVCGEKLVLNLQSPCDICAECMYIVCIHSKLTYKEMDQPESKQTLISHGRLSGGRRRTRGTHFLHWVPNSKTTP